MLTSESLYESFLTDSGLVSTMTLQLPPLRLLPLCLHKDGVVCLSVTIAYHFA